MRPAGSCMHLKTYADVLNFDYSIKNKTVNIIMKRLAILLTVLVLHQQIFSQGNVGVGTINPNPSAVLDIYSSNKGMLVPRVYLQSALDKTTILLPASGLLVYNTNGNLTGGIAFFYNSGTAAAPSWQRVGGIVLPYYSGAISSTSLFQIDNYNSTPTSSAIKGFGGNTGIGVHGESNSGTGIYAGSSGGTALQVDGKIKIAGNGQSPAAGKVLTSDASGNATWQGAIAFLGKGVKAGSEGVAILVRRKILFASTTYDLGNNFTSADISPYSTFTAPVNGIYHFDLKVSWLNMSSGFLYTILVRRRNGVEEDIATYYTHSADYFAEQTLNADADLMPDDEVYVIVRQTILANIDLNYSPHRTYFSGRLVIKL